MRRSASAGHFAIHLRKVETAVRRWRSLQFVSERLINFFIGRRGHLGPTGHLLQDQRRYRDNVQISADTPFVAVASWHFDGIGASHGDGRDDLVWRNDDGAMTIWTAGHGSFLPSAATYQSQRLDVRRKSWI